MNTVRQSAIRTRARYVAWLAALALVVVLVVSAALPAADPLAMPAQAQEELVSPSDG